MFNEEADALSRIPLDMVNDQESPQSFIGNALTKLNAVVETCSTVAIDQSASVVTTPNNSRLKWVEEQSNHQHWIDAMTGAVEEIGVKKT